MPTALLADDEPLLLAHLAERLATLWPQLQIVAQAGNGVEALAQLNALRPDFAFLDIRMPGLSGLQVAQAAGNTRIVFVTAYDEYALPAFEAAAVDYLVKPVSDTRLAQCISRLQRQSAPQADLTQLLAQLAGPRAERIKWLNVGLGDTMRVIAIDDVLYFQSSDKYTEVVTASERHLIRTSLKDLLPQLDPDTFVQIHRGAIVALPAVARIERDLLGRMTVQIRGREERLAISRSYAGQFRQM